MNTPIRTASAAESGTFLLGGDLPVHRLGFGGLGLTGAHSWGEPDDLDAARAALRRAVELDVNLVDTADAYGPGVSERHIAETLHPYPEAMVIATKGGSLRPGPTEWEPDGSPEHLRAALDGSLERLRLERIDLYQLHRPDPEVPIEESVGALADLAAEGKIRHIGLSNVTVEELERARDVAPIASVQNRYNLFDRKREDVLRRCEELGIAFLPWAPLARARLSHGGLLAAIAAAHGATPLQVVLAWLLDRSPVMLPIPSTSNPEHAEENVGAAAIRLREDERRRLDAVA